MEEQKMRDVDSAPHFFETSGIACRGGPVTLIALTRASTEGSAAEMGAHAT